MAQAHAQTIADLEPVYLFVSDHQALLDEALARLKDRVAGEADLNLNMDEFDADEAGPDEVLGAARVLPFLAEKRVVILKGAQHWSAAQLRLLADYLADPSPDACLVIAYKEGKPGALAKGASPLYAAAKEKGFLYERRGPRFPSEYPPWVVRRARESGFALDADAAAYLVEAVGTDLITLIQELDKLAIVYDQGARLDRQAVEAMVAPYDKAVVWDYLDLAFTAQLTAALRELQVLVRDTEPTAVLAQLVERLREVIRVRALLDRGLKPPAVARELKVPDWKVRKQADVARRFSAPVLIGLLELAVATEEEMKTSRLEGRLALDRMTVRICRAATSSPASRRPS